MTSIAIPVLLTAAISLLLLILNAYRKNVARGEGPSKEEREACHFDILYIAHVDGTEPIVVTVKGDKDPGYGSTSKMISDSAVCLHKDARDTAGGIWTTAPAMGDKLISRLQANAVVTFTEGY